MYLRVNDMNRKNLFIILTVLIISFAIKVQAETPALLKDLDVSNGFMIQFDKNTLTYTVELDEGESFANVIAVPANDECTIQIEGEHEKVKPGSEHIITVSVSDMQGNFTTYTLKVYAQAEKGGMSFLRCLNGTMSPQYRDTARNFYVIVPYDCSYADLDIRTWDKNAVVEVIGNENIEKGKRKRVMIKITDTNGTVSEYALYVYRQMEINSSINRSFLLSDIQINSGKIPVNFEPTKGYYRLEVPSSISKLDIKALADDRKNIVEITGSDTITDYEHNIVTIAVSNPDDETKGKSIYVLDFFHNSFVNTPTFTKLQLIAVCFAVSLISIVIFWGVSKLFKTKKNRKSENEREESFDMAAAAKE
jgi:hypothetical protein